MRFSDLDRRLDMLDLTSCLQERLMAQLMEMDKRLEVIGSQVGKCDASLSAMSLPTPSPKAERGKSKLMFGVSEMSSERTANIAATEGRRNSLTSIESLNQCSGLFQNRSPWAENVSEFLENPESGRPARAFSLLWPSFVMVTAIVTLVQTTGLTIWSGLLAAVCEASIDVLFGLELLLRYSISPKTCFFLKSAYNIIDILAALPIFLRTAVGLLPPDEGFIRFALLCIVPLLRLLKMLRWLKQIHLFARVLDNTREALTFLLFLLSLIVLFFASLFYLVEPVTVVQSLPQAMWFTIVTVTTVGYVPPETEVGHMVLSCLLIISVLYMAMPIGILGNAFTEVWKDRDLILLASRTEERLLQWGYTAADLPQIFALFDNEGKGELSVGEFKRMISAMRMGLTEDRLVEVFNLLDSDGGGSIDGKEFLKRLFPSTYYELYGTKPGRLRRKSSGERSRRPPLLRLQTAVSGSTTSLGGSHTMPSGGPCSVQSPPGGSSMLPQATGQSMLQRVTTSYSPSAWRAPLDLASLDPDAHPSAKV